MDQYSTLVMIIPWVGLSVVEQCWHKFMGVKGRHSVLDRKSDEFKPDSVNALLPWGLVVPVDAVVKGCCGMAVGNILLRYC